MSYINLLRTSRDKAAVAFQEFVLNVNKYPGYVFCFLEGAKGTDNPYYIPRLKNYIKFYYPIRCGGKKHVLKVRDLILNKPEYNKYHKAYCIDKDFDPSVRNDKPDIYETPCYSIENFYVTDMVFEEILCGHIGISRSDLEFQTCLELFRKLQSEYHNATVLFNSWYSLLVEYKHSTGTETGVNLDDKLPTGFVNISLNSITSNYDYNKLLTTFPNAPKIDLPEINKRISEFNRQNNCQVFRGKYELHFVCKFIELLVEDSRTTKTIIKNQINVHFASMSNDQALTILSCYAITPNCLSNYFKSFVANSHDKKLTNDLIMSNI